MEWKCWKYAFLRKSFSAIFLLLLWKHFVCVCLLEWESDDWSGFKHFKVKLPVWCLQTVQTHGIDTITTACHAVEQVSVCHTSLPARKGEVWWVSSLFQIWARWMNARVCAALQGLCCSPPSTETATPFVSLQNTARISPVRIKLRYQMISADK